MGYIGGHIDTTVLVALLVAAGGLVGTTAVYQAASSELQSTNADLQAENEELRAELESTEATLETREQERNESR